MPLDFLAEIMASIPAAALTEATLEAAPRTLNAEQVAAWRKVGINRVSLGVQSFVTAELRETGRRHTAQSVVSDVGLLRSHGISNINLDLIAGLPGQTQDSWNDSLDYVEQLAPPHVSVYIFEVDEDSRLGNELLTGGSRYGAGTVPSDDLVAEFYEVAVKRLAGAGIHRYEISNFARPGFESRHNLKYWRLDPYLGFGLDAHSFIGDRRYSAADELQTYLADPLAKHNDQRSDRAEEHFFVGLRLDAGIEPQANEWRRFEEPIEKWISAGMLLRTGNRLRLSPQGALVSNEIFADFLTTPFQHA
jgi:oxygen-independent coproporphyrinogen-3 oxidase